MFNPSLAQRIRYRPWRYTIPPTYAPDGSELTPGVKQTLQGVFILLSDELIALLAANLNQADADKLRSYAHRVTAEEAAEWHVPMWAGQESAVFIRVPAAVWNDPTAAPPAAVKQYFQHLWQEVSE